MMAFAEGRIIEAWHWNPLGIIVSLLYLLYPIAFISELIWRKALIMPAYYRMMAYLRSKPIAAIAILLVIIIWISNINKGL
jgi:hypothetical protein